MQNSFKTLAFFVFLFFVLPAWSRRSRLPRIAKAQTLAELQREAMAITALTAGNSELSENAKSTLEQTKDAPDLFYLNIKYNIKDMDIYETADIPNSFEKLSNAFLKRWLNSSCASKDLSVCWDWSYWIRPPDLNLILRLLKVSKSNVSISNTTKNLINQLITRRVSAFVSGLDLNRVGRNKSLLLNYKVPITDAKLL